MEMTDLTARELLELERLRWRRQLTGLPVGLLFLVTSLALLLVPALASSTTTVFSGIFAAFGFGLVAQR